MIYISELLPNPAGKDADGEWMEICAAGTDAESLSGWKLQNAKGKSFSLPDQTLVPYACAAFDYSQTKLALTNTGGAFYVVSPSGEITDTAIYEGTYKDDVSAMPQDNSYTRRIHSMFRSKKSVTERRWKVL